MARKRSVKGDGSITEVMRPDGKSYRPKRWRVCVSFGKDPITGKRAKAQRVVRGTIDDAKKARDQIRQERESGLTADARKVTFSDFAKRWSDYRRTLGRAREDTIAADERRLGYVGGFVGGVPLKDFTPELVESLYAAIRNDKADKGRSFGNTSMHKLHTLLKSMFRKAADYDLIVKNPFERVDAPGIDEPDRKTLTAEEGAALLAFVDAEELRLYRETAEKEARQHERGKDAGRSRVLGVCAIGRVLAVRVGLATGMRLGEVMGLAWGAVSEKEGTITVKQSLTGRGETKAPKTKAGARTIYVDATTFDHLSAWKSFQRSKLRSIGVEQTDETPVSSTDRGTYGSLANFGHWWSGFRDRAGFPGLRFHELRHTQASQLLASGVDVKTVQTRLGHSSASLTLDWYAHALPENDRKAARIIGDLFSEDRRNGSRIVAFKTA